MHIKSFFNVSSFIFTIPLLLANLQCSGGSNNSQQGGANADASGFKTISSDRSDASRGTKVTIPADAFEEEDLDLEQGEVIANDVTAAYLSLPSGGVSQGSAPVYVGFKDSAAEKGLANAGQIAIALPLQDENGLAIPESKYDRLLVFYQVENGNQSTFGYMTPGTFQIQTEPGLGLQAGRDYAVFYMRGEGIYQVALLPEGATIPTVEKTAPSEDPVPRLTTTDNDNKDEQAQSAPEPTDPSFSLNLDSNSFAMSSSFESRDGKLVPKIMEESKNLKGSQIIDFASVDNLDITADGMSISPFESEPGPDDGTGFFESKIMSRLSLNAHRFEFLEVTSTHSMEREFPNVGTEFMGAIVPIMMPSTLYQSGLNDLSSATPGAANHVGSLSFVDGYNRKSLSFDGLGNSHINTGIKASDLAGATGNKAWTIMMWVDPESGGVEVPNALIGSADFNIGCDSNYWYIKVGQVVGIPPESGDSLPYCSTYGRHLSIVYTPGTPNKVTVYWNGQQSVEVNLPNVTVSASDLLIGDSSASGYDPFMGEIDDVAIFPSALNATEIRELYFRGTRKGYAQARICESGSSCTSPYTDLNLLSSDGMVNRFDLDPLRGDYIQYKIVLEDETYGEILLPKLSAAKLTGKFLINSAPSIVMNAGQEFRKFTGITEEIEGNGTIFYQLSIDGGQTWLAYFEGELVEADESIETTNTAAEINSFASSIPPGMFSLRAWLPDDGSAAVKSIKLNFAE